MSLLNRWIAYLIIPAMIIISGAFGGTPNSLPDLDLYPTWYAVGLEITFPDGWDFEKSGSFEWRKNGGEWPPVFEWEIEREGEWEKTAYHSIEEFSSATGRESNGMVADPLFLSTEGIGAVNRVPYAMAPFGHYPQLKNPDAGDLRLKESSPCIDRGLLIPGINDETPDGRPDMGAFEFEKTENESES